MSECCGLGITLEQSREREAELFRTHKELKLLPQEYKGTDELAKKLAAVQKERINATLPTIRAQVCCGRKLAQAERIEHKMKE